MELDAARTRLPDAYRRALQLRDEGLGIAEIAVRLGIDEDVVPSLFVIGDAKLRRLLERT